MDALGILGFVFGVFGMLAYCRVSSLQGKVEALEEQLSKTRGTTYHESRHALLQAARSYIGQNVVLELKEGHEDVDIINYGNTKHGSNTVLDVDHDWMLMRISTPRGTKEKLIRMGSVERIALVREQ